MRRPARRAFRPHFDRLDERCLPALTPAQVTAAYGLNAITFSVNGKTVQGNGAGEDIAVVDAYHDPYIASDLQAFDRTFGLADPPLGVIDLAGNATDAGWAVEEALDVEWLHAIAPGAEIIVVEARSDSLSDLLAAENVARNLPGIVAISMSWGSNGFSDQTSLDSYFTAPAGHDPITFVAASGDEGASGGAEWPASSAYVLSVGGTTLNVATNGTYLGESTWSGSSGGYSPYVAEPSYQYSLQSTGRLMTPDVSFDGDPNTGVYVYSISPTTGAATWYQVGGTSLGAPAWTGIMAIVDQGRALSGQGSLNGATQVLPTLFSLPSTDFHKVGSYSSRSGTVTSGLGTPNGAALVYGLAFGTVTANVYSASAASTTAAGTAARALATSSTGTSSPTTATLAPADAEATASPADVVLEGATSAAPSRRPSPFLGLGDSLATLWRSLLDSFGSADD